jgi:hypothetical protein
VRNPVAVLLKWAIYVEVSPLEARNSRNINQFFIEHSRLVEAVLLPFSLTVTSRMTPVVPPNQV